MHIMMTAPILDPRLQSLEEIRWHVGNTPLHTMVRLSPKKGVEIHAKLEWQQFGGSVKARSTFDIITKAVVSGALTGRRLLDASTGSSGVAYAVFGAAADIPVTICIPENTSNETKHMLHTLGVELIETDSTLGYSGAREKAKRLSKENPDKYCFVDQLTHDSTVSAHYKGTGTEIWYETGGRVTHFIAGIGSSGTLTGVGRKLKELNPHIQVVGLQPTAQAHIINGWEFLDSMEKPSVYDSTSFDHIHSISNEETKRMMVRSAKEEGLLLSPSSAANLAGALKLAESIDEGVIVTILPDDYKKYGKA